MEEKSITCTYCAAINPWGTGRCLACGAPIELPVTPPMRVTVVDTPESPPVNTPEVPSTPISQQLKEGLTAVGSGLGALGVFTIIARTVAEAVAIAVSAFIIGSNAGSANATFQGAALYLLLAAGGGALLGLCVGLVSKRIIFTLLSAPVGTILGGVLARVLSLNAPRTPWLALFGIAGGVFFALLGGRRSAGMSLPCFQRARPILGLIGGLLFGLLGYAINYRIY
jgi:hypothetical protein